MPYSESSIVMDVLLLCIGRLKSPWVATGCAMYLQRLSSRCRLREIPASRERDNSRQREDESKRILDAADRERGSVLWVLDERGEGLSSRYFAQAIEKFSDRGTSLVVLLGGAYGFTDTVRARAQKVLQLSAMTLPHELCRLLFLEQLYRAQEILRGGHYHH